MTMAEVTSANSPGGTKTTTTTATSPANAVTIQPTSTTTAVSPLDIFAQFDAISVKQDIELLEVVTGFETNNRYKVFMTPTAAEHTTEISKHFTAIEPVLVVQERTTCCMRYWCKGGRAATLVVFDKSGRVVMTMERLLRCGGGFYSWCSPCCPCCLQKMEILGPSEELLGTIEQQPSCCATNLHVMNNSRETLFMVTGGACFCQGICCPEDIEFEVSEKSAGIVGKILKHWAGCAEEAFTDADNFTIIFEDKSLEVAEKALLFGALFLIDFMYFEHGGKKH